MIGYKKEFTGRMGNRLFQYHFMKQLSIKCDTEYFNSKIPDNKWFDDMNEKKLTWKPFQKKIKFSSKDIISLGKINFLEEVVDAISKNKIIILEPPILGDLFYDYLFTNPNNCIKIKEEYKLSNLDKNDEITNVAIHFRGTDFESWNKDAILDINYYLNAIDFIKEKETKNLIFHLFTDDLSLDSYKKVIKYLHSQKFMYKLGNMSQEAIFDFYTMSECDIIISSPSTFSIWAGIIGKEKKIIHSEKWINNRINFDDKFWIDLKKSNSDIYKLWSTL